MTSLRSRFVKSILAVAFSINVSSTANAALVTSNTISSPVVIDFSTQATVSNDSGPIQIGSLVDQIVTVQTVDGSNELYTNFDDWGLANNGRWYAPQTYVSFNLIGGLRFSFNGGPVSAVGGFMNYSIGVTSTHLIISALDAELNVLETYDITDLADIVTPGGVNAGAFRGIVRPTADIAFFEVSANSPVVDNLTFTPRGASLPLNPVPTISIYGLVLTTLGLLLVANPRLRLSSKLG